MTYLFFNLANVPIGKITISGDAPAHAKKYIVRNRLFLFFNRGPRAPRKIGFYEESQDHMPIFDEFLILQDEQIHSCITSISSAEIEVGFIRYPVCSGNIMRTERCQEPIF